MSDSGPLIPISDEQAKAVQEALKALQKIGGFLKETFGTVPQDLVGLFGGDYLKVRRAENFVRVMEKSKERLRARGVTPEPPRLSILLPLVAAAADEEDDELQDMWARLLAAAADPARAGQIRLAFVETVKKMDPLDALILREYASEPRTFHPAESLQHMVTRFGATEDEILVSFNNLETLECLGGADVSSRHITPKGRLLIRAVSD